MSKLVQLSTLKAGTAFILRGVIVGGVDSFDRVAVKPEVSSKENDVIYLRSDRLVEVVEPPPRDLVKGERIKVKGGSECTGEYLGRGWAWWDNLEKVGPSALKNMATTQFYEVITC